MKKIFLLSLIALAASCSTNWDAENGFDDSGKDAGSEIDTTIAIDRSMYSEARVFPGLVDTLTEHHVDTTIMINMNQPYTSGHGLKLFAPSYLSSGNVNYERVPQPIYSTGVYAGAGELVCITLPEGNTYGLTAQIGVHTDDLSNEATKLREPLAYFQKTLYPGRNLLRAPLGGYIWIVRNQNANQLGDVSIHFCGGVYSAADYVKGMTDIAQWERKVRSTTVPWLDIRSSRVALSISRNQVVSLMDADSRFCENLQRCLDYWDQVAQYRYEQLGLTKGDENTMNRMPDFHDRLVFDVELKDSRLLHVNNEQATMLLQNSSFFKQLLSWQTIKEMNGLDVYNTFTEKYLMRPKILNSDWDAAEEKIPMYRVTRQMLENGDVDTLANYGFGFNTLMPSMLSYIKADSVKHIDSDFNYTNDLNASSHLLMLAQLNEYGKHNHQEKEWEWYNTVAKQYRLGDSRRSSYYRLLCEHYKTNFESLFDFYGFTLADADRAYGQQYTLLTEEVWKINPGSLQPYANVGKLEKRWKYRVCRDAWEALATYAGNYGVSNEDDTNKKTIGNLFDNSLSTYWGSYLKKDDATYALPYYIIIDMKTATKLNGIYFANGWDRCVSSFKVQTLATTADIHIDDSDKENWQDWGMVSQSISNSLRNEKFVEMPSVRTTRYIRLVFDKENLYVRPDETLKPTDAKWFDSNHRNRIQRLAEFGVWRY